MNENESTPDDWLEFTEAVPWFLKPGSQVSIVERIHGWDIPDALTKRFTALSRLLSIADVTTLTIEGTQYVLCAWNSLERHRIGWLCLPPSHRTPRNLCDDHTHLLASFGGIVERFNEPSDTWLVNQNDVLTEREAVYDASFIMEYLWAFESAGVRLPIEPTDYYSIAREANGNSTLCHRTSSEVILFATDHCYDFVDRLDGCPEYTLYRFNGVVAFCDWVEAIAQQWLAHIDAK